MKSKVVQSNPRSEVADVQGNGVPPTAVSLLPSAVIITSTAFPQEPIYLRLSRQVIEVVIHFTTDLT
jgi:hypothetical protein